MHYIVNAPSASVGGAKYILDKFIKDHSNLKLFIICPKNIDFHKSKSHTFFHVQTSGIFTHFFTMFILPFIKFYLNAPIVSFTNSNSIFSTKNDFTYFHNTNLFNDKNIKYKIYKLIFIISSFRSTILTQTDYSASLIPVFFRFVRKSWPGITITSESSINADPKIKRILFCSSNLDDPNKNFNEFVKLSGLKFSLTLLVPSSDCFIGITSLGNLSRDIYLDTLKCSDALFVSSYSESLCLPIFEALLLGKKIIISENKWSLSLVSEFFEFKDYFFFYNDICSVTENDIMTFLANDVRVINFDKIIKPDWGIYV